LEQEEESIRHKSIARKNHSLERIIVCIFAITKNKIGGQRRTKEEGVKSKKLLKYRNVVALFVCIKMGLFLFFVASELTLGRVKEEGRERRRRNKQSRRQQIATLNTLKTKYQTRRFTNHS
jgi:formate hydrogenlyase subunit 3/multisubunit Na+/H+ antiporter MnhD subunit